MNMNTRARVHASSNRANEDKQEGEGVADRCRRPFLFFSVARVHPLSLSLLPFCGEHTLRDATRPDLCVFVESDRRRERLAIPMLSSFSPCFPFRDGTWKRCYDR